MYRILLIEDDRPLAEAMKKQLESYGNEVILTRDLRRIPEEFAEAQPQLVLLDIMLPYKDGYFWCNEIRRQSGVPIVFISSASDNMNVVMAITMGGDDFIAKPVDPMVLNAKVQAILRRTYEMGSSHIRSFPGGSMNLNDSSVEIGGVRVELTRNEMRILETLLENRGKIVSRDTLMLKLWQSDLYVEENTLTVNVSRLRKKLEDRGLKDLIHTRPGSGYVIL